MLNKIKQLAAERKSHQGRVIKDDAISGKKETSFKTDTKTVTTKVNSEDGRTKIMFSSTKLESKDIFEATLLEEKFVESSNKQGLIFESQQKKFKVNVKSKLSKTAPAVIFSDDNHKISLVPQGRLVKGIHNGNTIKFPKFNSHDDLEYIIHERGLKEQIIVHEKRDDSYEYEFKLAVENLVVLHDGDDIVFRDEKTYTPLFRMGQLVMLDSDGKESNLVHMKLITEKELKVKLSADQEWINSADRIFPVTIDPQIQLISEPITLSNIIDGNKEPAKNGKYKVGVYDGKNADLIVTVDTKPLIEQIQKEKLTAFQITVNLTLSPGTRIKNSNGFLIYAEDRIIGENPFKNDVASIDITSLVRERLHDSSKNLLIELTVKSKKAVLSGNKSISIDKALAKSGYTIINLSQETMKDIVIGAGVKEVSKKAKAPTTIYNDSSNSNLDNSLVFDSSTDLDKASNLTKTIVKDIGAITDALKLDPTSTIVSTSNMRVINADVLTSTAQVLNIKNILDDISITTNPIGIFQNGVLMVPNVNFWDRIKLINTFEGVIIRIASFNDYTQIKDCGIAIDYIEKGIIPSEAVKLDYPIAQSGTTTINLFDMEFIHNVPLTSIKSNNLEIPLVLTYSSILKNEKNSDATNKFMGKGWKTNFHQYLIKSDFDKETGASNITYIDGANTSHHLYQKWYYEVSGVKYYVSRDKIYLDNDQKLKFKEIKDSYKGEIHEVKCEIDNNEGLSFFSLADLTFRKKNEIDDNSTVDYYENEDIQNLKLRIKNQKEINSSLESTVMDVMNNLEQLYSQRTFNAKLKSSLSTLKGYNSTIQDGQESLFKTQKEYYEPSDGRDGGIKMTYASQVKNCWEDDDSKYDYSPASYIPEKINGSKCDYRPKYRFPKKVFAKADNVDKFKTMLGEFSLYFQIESYRNQRDYRKVYKDQANLHHQMQVDSNEQSINATEAQISALLEKSESYIEKFDKGYFDLKDLEETLEGLIQKQKESANDFIIDQQGNILGFDYFGKLVMLQDIYENQIDIVYDKGKIKEIKSAMQTIGFSYKDELLNYIIDPRGRKIKLKHGNDLLTQIKLASPDAITNFFYDSISEDLLSIEDATGLCQHYVYNDAGLNLIKQDTKVKLISNEEIDKTGELEEVFKHKINFIDYNMRQIENVLEHSFVTYTFDDLGRKLVVDNNSKTFNDVEINYFDKDELMFSGTGRYKLFQDGTSNIIKDIELIEVGKSHLVKLAFSEEDRKMLPHSNVLMLLCNLKEMNVPLGTELTIKAKAIGSESWIREFTFKDVRQSYVGLPIIIKREELAELHITISSNQDISDSNVEVALVAGIGEYREYDSDYKLISIITGLSTTEYSDFDEENPRVVTIKDRFDTAKESYFAFDSNGKPTFSQNHLGNCRELIYNNKGQVVESRQYNKNNPTEVQISKTSYDEFGNPSTKDGFMTNSDGTVPQIETSYLTGTSLIEKETSLSGSTTCYGYDYLDDRLTEMSTTMDGAKIWNNYKYRFGLLTSLSHHGVQVDYTYDGFGRPILVLVAGKQFATYEYSRVYEEHFNYVVGNKTKVTLADKATTETIVDSRGLLKEIIATDYEQNKEIVTKLFYNDNDQLESRSASNGEIETLTYNVDRLESRTIVDGISKVSESVNYNENNVIDSKTIIMQTDGDKKAIINHLIFDEKESSIIKEVEIAEHKYTTKIGARTDSKKVKFAYDANSRVVNQTLTLNDEELISNNYDYLTVDNNITQLIRNHATEVNGETLTNQKYTYDASGNIIAIEMGEENHIKYTYDSLNRLIREDNTVLNKTFTFKYDKGGNIISKQEAAYTLREVTQFINKFNYTYQSTGWKDKLISFNGEAIEYAEDDVLGRPISYRGKALEWSGDGQLLGIENVATYTYNNAGIRTSKTVDGKTTKFTLLNTQILRSETEANDLVFHYASDKLFGFSHNGTSYQYVRNIQGDITHILNIDGTVAVEYAYDAWGNCTIIKDIIVDEETTLTIGVLNPFRYRGYFFDAETGLFWCTSRYYDPEIGRFISPDSLEYLQPNQINGLNLYAYCGNNPISRIDPLGTSWWNPTTWDWGKIGTIALVAVTSALFVAAIIASAGTVGALVGLGAAYLGASAATVATAVTIGTIATYVVAGGVAAFAASDIIGIGTDNKLNPIRDYLMFGNQTAYDITKTTFNVLGTIAVIAGIVGPSIIRNANPALTAGGHNTPGISQPGSSAYARGDGYVANFYDKGGNWSFRIEAWTQLNHTNPHFHLLTMGSAPTMMYSTGLWGFAGFAKWIYDMMR